MSDSGVAESRSFVLKLASYYNSIAVTSRNMQPVIRFTVLLAVVEGAVGYT